MCERLIGLVDCATREYSEYSTEMFQAGNYGMESLGEYVADYLLKRGVLVPPDELFSIVDKGTIYASVTKAKVDWLPLYVIKNPQEYGYYRTREEAEQALKGNVPDICVGKKGGAE